MVGIQGKITFYFAVIRAKEYVSTEQVLLSNLKDMFEYAKYIPHICCPGNRYISITKHRFCLESLCSYELK